MITSIACGHLRECQASFAVRDGKVGRIYAIDQDHESLKTVEDEQSSHGVIPILGSVVGIIKGELVVPESDLIYSMGLFDYLTDRLATRLIIKLFASLTKGGTLLIANFTPSSHGRGYMDGFMEWGLFYRTKRQLISPLSHGLGAGRTYLDQHGNVAYLELAEH